MGKGTKESDLSGEGNKKISRKEAIKKTGYAAFSAATMMLLLNNPAKVYAASPDTHDSPSNTPNFEEDGFQW